MASTSSQFGRFLARTAGRVRFVTLVLGGAVAFASVAAAADPFEVAMVESTSGKTSGVEFMDYVHLGQVIHLGSHDTIVLSYKASCVRETITGGTVTVGIERSQVQSGEVERIVGRCGSGKREFTDAQGAIAGRIFRGGLMR
jgi:hypothetical protein